MAPTDDVSSAAPAAPAQPAGSAGPADFVGAAASAGPTAPQPTASPPLGDAPEGPGTQPADEASAPPKPESLVDAIADLMQMAVNYLRQETAGVMRDKVVLPGQQLGQLIAFALAAAGVLFLSIGFIAVAFLLVLAQYMGWPGALLFVGLILLLGAGLFTYFKVRSIQT